METIVNLKVDYNIKELKQELTCKSKHLFEAIIKKPRDFESDILIAAQKGKLSSIQYLIEKQGINVNKKAPNRYADHPIFYGSMSK